MAPNPFVVLRRRDYPKAESSDARDTALNVSIAILLTSLVVVLAATLHWAERWLLSGAAIESLLLVYGSSAGSRILPEIPLWSLPATLNLLYAVPATSWLLYGVFAAIAYPTLLFTCLFQFTAVADFARKYLRKLLRGLHFTRDKIAIFGLPALEIDTDVRGLFVVRGVTMSVSSLTVVAYGLELGKSAMM